MLPNDSTGILHSRAQKAESDLENAFKDKERLKFLLRSVDGMIRAILRTNVEEVIEAKLAMISNIINHELPDPDASDLPF